MSHKAVRWKCGVSGALAGFSNGFFGAGGGMVLVPLLLGWVKLEEKKAFATSVAVILPICAVSCAVYWWQGLLELGPALPFLVSGAVGSWLGGRWYGRVSGTLLRRIFALLTIYGGDSMPVLNLLAGAATGVLSAFGIGGGTLLLLYLTFLAGFSQQTAQGINLLYFLPTAGASLPTHLRRGAIDRRAALTGGVWGCIAAVGGSLLAAVTEPGLLRGCFGVYLIVTGCVTLFGGRRASRR